MQLKFCILFFFSLTFSSSFSQNTIKGKVLDSNTKKPLAFVNLIFNKQNSNGISTNINGKFLFTNNQKITTINVSYVGYKKKEIRINSTTQLPLVILLKPSEIVLQTVEIKAGENPANRIIRTVIKNKDNNNPKKIKEFTYKSYNKVTYDLSPNAATADIDSVKQKMFGLLKGGHFMITESVTERKVIRPNLDNETIIGTKVSGFKTPTFAPLATDMQPFSFYDEQFKILDINYLNPIANNSLNKYYFEIKDTLYNKKDTVFILVFRPKKNKNFDGLKGLLYINSNKYAIQNVIAQPFEVGLIDVKIQQQYQLINDSVWFPEQLNFELIMKEYPNKSVGLNANGKSYIKDVLFEKTNKKEFQLESVLLDKNAAKQDFHFWQQQRLDSLTPKDTITYHVIDSLGEKLHLDAMMKFGEKLAIGKIPVSVLDIDLEQLFIQNKFEGYRAGLGLHTNEKISKRFSVGGFFGYGTKDHLWKYGGDAIIVWNKKNEINSRLFYANSLTETGFNKLNNFNAFSIRSYIASQMNKNITKGIAFGFRTLKYAKFNFSFNQIESQPLYSYNYVPIPDYSLNLKRTDVSVYLKFAYKERFVQSLNQRISTGTKYPILYVYYTQGLKNVIDGQINYQKLQLRIEKKFNIKNIGKTTIQVSAGWTNKNLPYYLLFTGEGGFDKSLPVVVSNSFQTATPYEFLSDEYIRLHFAHNFGHLLFKSKKFKPQLSLIQNVGYGKLAHPENHQNIVFKTKEKTFLESGLQIDNIIRFKYANLFYVGLGGGIYYRYGAYHLPKTTDNIAAKISFVITTK